MRRFRIFQVLATFVLLLSTVESPAQESKLQPSSSGIPLSGLEEKLNHIASEEMEGRLTGSEGIRRAAEYITSVFDLAGLQPFDGTNGFLHPFSFVSEVSISSESNFLAVDGTELVAGEDFHPLTSSASGETTGEVVFAGYGITLTGQDGFTYDSYAGLDVREKIVMVLDGIPEGLDDNASRLLQRSHSAGYRQMLARRNGANALLIVSPEINLPDPHEVVGNSGIIALNISEKSANLILSRSGLSDNIQTIAGQYAGDSPPSNRPLMVKSAKVSIKTKVERIRQSDNNIIGVVHSDDTAAPYIFIGAHYDHLGKGEVNSRDTGINRNKTHYGADDNGSGIVAVIGLAEYFAELKKEYPDQITSHLAFCLWSGEEIGLLGSSSFAAEMPFPKEKVKAYLNFDMVGRLENNKLEIQGTGSATEWNGMLAALNEDAGFDLHLTENPFLPTDATSFYVREIPVISFFTGIHADYHTTRDITEKINFEGLLSIVEYGSQVIREMMKPELSFTFRQVDRPGAARRNTAKVTLGTIPAYAGNDEEGLEIQGVRPGGPADKAGMLNGDVIVQIGGKEVHNIHDFMNILRELEAGKETQVVVKRNDKPIVLRIVPEARE